MTIFLSKDDGPKKMARLLDAAKSRMPAKICEAHKHSSKHRAEIRASETCGCFYCLTIFKSSEIQDWIDEGQTALCARCGVDSVIGAASGFPITKEFLEEMHKHWF